MEILIECLMEIFFEGIIKIIKTEKISKWVRIPLFLFVCSFYIGLVSFFSYLAIHVFLKKEFVGSLVLFCIVLLLVVLFLGFILHLSKKK